MNAKWVPCLGRHAGRRQRLGLAAVAAVMAALGVQAAEPDLLLHWPLDEGRGAQVRDRSGQGLHGQLRADWTNSPAGRAVFLDGTPGRLIAVSLPPALRPGTNSWTFTAWVRPVELAHPGAMNQRRLLSYGAYPDGSMVIDVLGSGTLAPHLTYKDAQGRVRAAGLTGFQTVRTGVWSHVAVVCDRAAGRLGSYLNGLEDRVAELPAGFAPDFSVGGNLTLGSTWQNFFGAVDEVKLFRRALSGAEVRQEFQRLRAAFNPLLAPEQELALQRHTAADVLETTGPLWAARRFGAVRQRLAGVVADPTAPPAVRSLAHLRLARSYQAEGDLRAARGELARIADEPAYPRVHRAEARALARELERAPRAPAGTTETAAPEDQRTRLEPVRDFAAEVFVSPQGSATGDGSRAQPLATLNQARDRVRQWRAGGLTGAVAVTVLPGEYPVTETFALGPEDCGRPGAPVVYRAAEPGRAVFYGGLRLRDFTPVRDPAVRARLPAESRDRVWECDLRALGVTHFGELRVRGFGQPPSPPTLEVFADGAPLTPARWPNEGFVRARRVVEPGSAREERRPSVFEYDSDRHARWQGVSNIWLFGYFRYLWADAALPVAAIDPQRRTVTTAEPYNYGGGMSDQQGLIYYVFNLLEELDAPGEWYLDRARGRLYLYPPAPPDRVRFEIGLWEQPLAVLRQVAHVRLEGLTFDLARFNGLVLEECEECVLAGCTVSRLAGNGITLQGGRANRVLGCDVHTLGRRGIEVFGGDRATLRPGGHVVENCHIHHIGRLDRTYTPAIHLEGVGHRAAHNLMHHAPSSVMRLEGNDHLVEFNDVHTAVFESDDQGAMELFGNPTYRGVVFRYNRFRDIGKLGTEPWVHGQAALRFDDAISGMLVYGNLFLRAARGNFGAIQINGGRDNLIDNNLFVDCPRGLTGGWYPDNPVWRRLRGGQVPPGFFTNELYRARYPDLARMLEPGAVNSVWRNIFFRCGPPVGGNRAHWDLLDNVEYRDADPGFVDAARGDFRLRPDAPVLARIPFRPFPLEAIGLYPDPYRARWPVENPPAPPPEPGPARRP
jgi:hypothetical protein